MGVCVFVYGCVFLYVCVCMFMALTTYLCVRVFFFRVCLIHTSNRSISLMGSVHQWPGTPGFNPVSCYTKDSSRWYLMSPCLSLSIMKQGVRGKWSNPWKGVTLSPTHQRSSYWKRSGPYGPRQQSLYIQQLCEDTGCNHEDQPEAMSDREKWRERVRDIRAGGTTWWWWWWYIYIWSVLDTLRSKFRRNCSRIVPTHDVISVISST